MTVRLMIMQYGNRKNRIHLSIVFCAIIFIMLPMLFCDVSEPETESEKEIEILVPEPGREYSYYDKVYVVAKFDPDLTSSLIWEYSIDDGKEWNSMYLIPARDSKYPNTEDWAYDVQTWFPELDSIKNTEVLIQAIDYDEETRIDKKGPFKIN